MIEDSRSIELHAVKRDPIPYDPHDKGGLVQRQASGVIFFTMFSPVSEHWVAPDSLHYNVQNTVLDYQHLHWNPFWAIGTDTAHSK